MVVDSTRRIVAAALVEQGRPNPAGRDAGRDASPASSSSRLQAIFALQWRHRLAGSVRLGSAYSIFDDRPTNTHYTCFLAQATQDCTLEGQLVPIDDITALDL